jgi:hypothetical protein
MSILLVERFQIQRIKDNIIKYHNHTFWKRDVERINLALRLLDIIEENGRAEPTKCTFINMPFEDGYYKLVTTEDPTWNLDVYVNIKNSNRFSTLPKKAFDDKKYCNLYKDSLRLSKAWYLYNKLRLLHLKDWWE